MNVKIIDGCIGCGLCEATCPHVFALNSSGVAEVISNDITSSDEAEVKAAADGCPVNVIVVE